MNSTARILFFACALATQASAVSGANWHIRVQEAFKQEDPSIVMTGMEYQFPITEVRITNQSFQRDMKIQGFLFKLRWSQIDTSPRLVFSLFDCMGDTFVKVRNVGWGPYQGGRFELFPQDAYADSVDRVSNQSVSVKLVELLDIKNSSVFLPRIESGDFAIVRVAKGPNAVPYVFRRSGHIDFEPLTEDALILGRRIENFSPNVRRWPDGLARLPHSGSLSEFSGSCVFDGALFSPRGRRSTVTYLGEHLHTLPEAADLRLLEAQHECAWYGGFYSNWDMAFGNYTTEGGAEPAGENVFGVAVDYGFYGPTEREHFSPCNLIIKPRQSLKLRVQSIGSASASIGTSIHWLDANVPTRRDDDGTSRPPYEKLIDCPTQRILRPKSVKFDIHETRTTLRFIAAEHDRTRQQESFSARAETIAAKGLPSPEEPWISIADLVGRTKQFADAILVGRVLKNRKLDRTVAEAIAKAIVEYGPSMDQSVLRAPPAAPAAPAKPAPPPPPAVPGAPPKGARMINREAADHVDPQRVNPLVHLLGSRNDCAESERWVVKKAHGDYGELLIEAVFPHVCVEFPDVAADATLTILRDGRIPNWLSTALQLPKLRAELARRLSDQPQVLDGMPPDARFMLDVVLKRPFQAWDDSELRWLPDGLLVWGVQTSRDPVLRDHVLKLFDDEQFAVHGPDGKNRKAELLREAQKRRCVELLPLVIRQLEEHGNDEEEQRPTLLALEYVRTMKTFVETRHLIQPLADSCPLGLVRNLAREIRKEIAGTGGN